MPGSVMLEIDASELQAEMERLKSVMKPETFNKAMYGIFRRTGSHVRMILKKDLPVEYNINSPEVGKAVKNAKVTLGGSGAGCAIPVTAARRHIGGGGRGYTARGHRRGWASVKSGHYDVKVHVYRSSWGTLPSHMPDTGNPPFRNVPSKLNGLAFTRDKGASFRPNGPINPVMGIAIPQMPMNRSQPDVQADIMKYMKNRIEARIQALIAGR